MKHLFISLVLLTNVSPAEAQTIPYPSCWPADVSGTGSKVIFGESLTYRYAAWTCPIAGGTDPTKLTVSIVIGDKGKSFTNPGVTKKSLDAVLAAYWKSNVKSNLDSALYTGIKTEVYAKLKVKPLPAPVVQTKQFRDNPAGVATPVYSSANIIPVPADNNPTK